MKRADEGFTLVELLIAVLLLGLIMSALVTAMTVSFRTVDATRQRVTDTTGAQLVASWLASDAQSARHINPSSSCVSGSGKLLELRWTDAETNSAVTDVVYKVEAADAGNSQLSRYVYDGSCTLQSQRILVRDLSSVSGANYAICIPGKNPVGHCDGVPADDDASTRVGLHLTALSNTLHSDQYSSYTFEVFGSRRDDCKNTPTPIGCPS
jgi:prepilin-type N-terminal cleavage/methylation domain-containing protein